MICLQGKVICGGVISGLAYIFHRKAEKPVSEHKTLSLSEELNRLSTAVSSVKDMLTKCSELSETETEKDIFEIHRMMLEDEDFTDYLYGKVREDFSAENAAEETKRYFTELFRNTNDEYMIARTDDICDICDKLISYLTNGEISYNPEKGAIIVAEELLPGDLMFLKKTKPKGIIMYSGSAYSHVSILIKEMGIPALICENCTDVKSGMKVLLDAENGTVCFDPDTKTEKEFLKSEKSFSEKRKIPFFGNLPCKVYVNIGNPNEVCEDMLKKCDGIGLFRTEYMYFGRSDLPDEEEQFAVYKNLLLKAKNKPVTVRTFDIGSDKSADALKLEKEENPALGFRGVRVYSLYPEVFKTQIRALLRASVYGNLRVMYPMVTSCEEIEKIKKIVSDTAKELSVQGIEHKIPVQGVMIETPAAALLSGELAKKADFFSVGTNDLVQYTTALDRQNGKLDMFCDKNYEAVMLLIKNATQNAHKNGIETGICGELASDFELTEKWIDMGIDYLSVSPCILSK